MDGWNSRVVLHGWTATRQIVIEILSAGRLCWAQACSHGGNEIRRKRHGILSPWDPSLNNKLKRPKRLIWGGGGEYRTDLDK